MAKPKRPRKAKKAKAKGKSKAAPAAKYVSCAAYARHRKQRDLDGQTGAAVSKAIHDGRLKRAVVMVPSKRGAQPKIRDVALADQEWEANTRTSSAEAEPPPDAPDREVSLAEARRRHEIEQWRQSILKREATELELAVRRGQLVAKEDAAAAVFEDYSKVRSRMLQVASRLRQRFPHLPIAVTDTLDELLREGLEELGTAGDDAASG